MKRPVWRRSSKITCWCEVAGSASLICGLAAGCRAQELLAIFSSRKGFRASRARGGKGSGPDFRWPGRSGGRSREHIAREIRRRSCRRRPPHRPGSPFPARRWCARGHAVPAPLAARSSPPPTEPSPRACAIAASMSSVPATFRTSRLLGRKTSTYLAIPTIPRPRIFRIIVGIERDGEAGCLHLESSAILPATIRAAGRTTRDENGRESKR